MYELRAFDREWNIVKDLDDEELKIASQISDFKKHNVKPTDPVARQLSKISSRPIHNTYLETMLFSYADHKTIAEKADIHERVVYYFEKIFFDTDEFLGKLDRVEFFQNLINDNKPGDGDFVRGVMFKNAFSFGWTYVTAKFNLNSTQEFGTALMEIMAREAFYRWSEQSSSDVNSRNFVRDTKDIMQILDMSIKATDGASNEKTAGLAESLIQLNEESLEDPKVVIMKVFDYGRQLFLDAPEPEIIEVEVEE